MWWTHRFLVWSLACALAGLGTVAAQEALPGVDPGSGPGCLADEVQADAPELAVGAIDTEISPLEDNETSADPNVTVAGPAVVAAQNATGTGSVAPSGQNHTCTHAVAPASAAGGAGGQPGEMSDAVDAEERLPPSPANGSSPPDEVLDTASTVYVTTIRAGEKFLELPVSPPEDPTRPQDTKVKNAEPAEELYEPLENLNRNTTSFAEENEAPHSTAAPENQTQPREQVRSPEQANVEGSDPASSPDAPPPSPPPSPLTTGDPTTAWTPSPIESAVMAAAIAGSFVLVLAFIVPHLRTCASILRRAIHGVPVLSLLVRIKSHKAIEDPKRRALYHVIHDNPGISNKELCDAVGMSRRNVEHHLIVVSRAGLIVSESIGRGRHYYPAAAGLDRKQRRACALLRIERNREVLQAIQQNPGMTLTHLMKVRGLHASGAHRVLNSLHEAGLVQRSRVGTSVQYQAVNASA